MLQTARITKRIGARVLLDEITYRVDGGERVGLVGPNGAGKSTFLKLLAGEAQADEGAVIVPKGAKVGYLPQDGIVYRGRSIRAETAAAFDDALTLRTRADELARIIETETHRDDYAALLDQYTELEARIAAVGADAVLPKVERVLAGLGFDPARLDDPVETLSGGQMMRVALAKLLLQRPAVLLLDEPTNHLDIEARYRLLDELKGYDGAVILVSHDRYVLDQVVTRITELFNGKITDYPGNYSRYEVEREARIEALRKAKEEQEAEIERAQRFIDRFRAKATKAAAVQSRVKAIEKMEAIELPEVRRRIRFRFPQPERSGTEVLRVEGLRFAYHPTKPVLKQVNLDVFRGRKVALVGVNGAGKSTMLKLIAGRLTPHDGRVTIGHNVNIAYFAQDQAKELDETQTVLESVTSVCPFEFVPQVRKLLGAFLFSGDDVEKRVAVLSGGERNRVALCRLLLRPANLLLLDEPTNHLDIDAKDVLLQALRDYEGTVLFVSHDRHFLDGLSTDTAELNGGVLDLYPGPYNEWFEARKRRAEAEGNRVVELAPGQVAQSAAKPAPKADTTDDREARRVAQEQAKRDKREAEKRKKRLEEAEAAVTLAEGDVKALEARLADPAVYADAAEFSRLHREYDSAKRKLDRALAAWEAAAGD